PDAANPRGKLRDLDTLAVEQYDIGTHAGGDAAALVIEPQQSGSIDGRRLERADIAEAGFGEQSYLLEQVDMWPRSQVGTCRDRNVIPERQLQGTPMRRHSRLGTAGHDGRQRGHVPATVRAHRRRRIGVE